MQHPVDGRERSEEQGERRTQRRPHQRGRVDGTEPQDERDRGSERVLAEADTRLAVEEGVIQSVNKGDGG
ncbi:MAG: hypothetical protein ACRDPU_11530, partial [Thermoleophilia bacterium]